MFLLQVRNQSRKTHEFAFLMEFQKIISQNVHWSFWFFIYIFQVLIIPNSSLPQIERIRFRVKEFLERMHQSHRKEGMHSCEWVLGKNAPILCNKSEGNSVRQRFIALTIMIWMSRVTLWSNKKEGNAWNPISFRGKETACWLHIRGTPICEGVTFLES